MKGIRYTDEFKSEAIKQITERGHDVSDVAQRLGVSTKSLYKWRHEMALQKRPAISADVAALKQEVARLNKALKRATEERDILKKAAVYSRCIAVATMHGKRPLCLSAPLKIKSCWLKSGSSM